jgi:hypothetical protein
MKITGFLLICNNLNKKKGGWQTGEKANRPTAQPRVENEGTTQRILYLVAHENNLLDLSNVKKASPNVPASG